MKKDGGLGIVEYCIEGERGFIRNFNAGENYLESLQKQLKEIGWL